MLAMGIQTLEEFPFPTSPPRQAVSRAISLLTYLGAIKREKTSPALAWLYSLGKLLMIYI